MQNRFKRSAPLPKLSLESRSNLGAQRNILDMPATQRSQQSSVSLKDPEGNPMHKISSTLVLMTQPIEELFDRISRLLGMKLPELRYPKEDVNGKSPEIIQISMVLPEEFVTTGKLRQIQRQRQLRDASPRTFASFILANQNRLIHQRQNFIITGGEVEKKENGKWRKVNCAIGKGGLLWPEVIHPQDEWHPAMASLNQSLHRKN